MAKHYSTKDFFRNTPNAMLARYFKARDVLQDFDFASMKETKQDSEPLYSARKALPEPARAQMESAK